MDNSVIQPYNDKHLIYNSKYKVFSKFYRNNSLPSEFSENAVAVLQSGKVDSKYKKHSLLYGALPLLAAFLIVGFTRGFQKNTSKYLDKFKTHLETRRDVATIKDFKKQAKFYESAIRKINYFIKKSDSINNITSLKDVLFMRAMYKTSVTKKMHNYITKKFEDISRKTVVKSYQNTEKKFNKMCSVFDALDEYILKDSPDEVIQFKGKTYTKRELINIAKSHRETAKLLVDGFISKESQDNRYKYMKDVTSNLYSEFWDASFKDFWTKSNKFKRKEMWQTFIAAEKLKGNKTLLHDNVAYARNALSYTDADREYVINDCLKQIKDVLPLKDEVSFEVLKKLEWFVKNPELMKSNREMFLKELAKLEHTELDKGNLDNIGEVQRQSKNTCLKIIKEMLDENATGEIQDMLDIYYKIAPFELSQSGGVFSINDAIKSFDKSVNLETVELFDKIRDLELGSAPTDVLTIFLSFLMISKGLGFAKNNDERLSIALKSGIPITGAILTTLISATKLISGGKSLALGFISGIVLNQAGVVVDYIRKNKSVIKNQLNL